MKNAKEILTENRESVISSIKWIFKVFKSEDVKVKMIEFLSFCNEFSTEFQNAVDAKNTQKQLKFLVQKMAMIQKTEQPKSRKWNEIAEDIADKKGLHFNTLTGNMYSV